MTVSGNPADQHHCPLCLRACDDARDHRLPVFSDFFRALVGTHPGTVPIQVPQLDGTVSVANPEGSLDEMQVIGVCADCTSDLLLNVERPTQPILDRITRGVAYDMAPFDMESLARWGLTITLLTTSANPQKLCGNVGDALRRMVGDYAVPHSTMLYGFGMREGHVARIEFRNLKATEVATGHCTVVGATSIIGLPHLTLVSLYGADAEWLRHTVDYFNTATKGLHHVQFWPADSATAIPITPEITASDVADLFGGYVPPSSLTGGPPGSA